MLSGSGLMVGGILGVCRDVSGCGSGAVQMASVSRVRVSPWTSWPLVCRRRSCPWFVGGATASVISAISCSTDVTTSRGYALELFGALSLQSLRVAITIARGRSLHQDSDPSTPHATALPHPITAKETPCCRTTRNRYISSKYSRDPLFGSLAWSPDGTRIAYNELGHQLWVGEHRRHQPTTTQPIETNSSLTNDHSTYHRPLLRLIPSRPDTSQEWTPLVLVLW